MENTPETAPVSIAAASTALTAELVARYPAFAAMLPLIVGVHEELVAAGYDPALLRKCVFKHVASTSYLKNMAKCGKRYNLDGTEAGDLDPEHVEHARKAVAERARKNIEDTRMKKERKEQDKANAVAKAEIMAKVAAKSAKAGKPAAPVKPAPAKQVANTVQPVAVAMPAPAVAVVVKKKRIVVVPK